MEKPYWRQLEELVADIQRDLAPGAEVLHNVKLKGRLSGVDRQIDVLVRQSIGQYEMKIAIDCKDYASAVDVKGVEEFFGLVNDVGAHQGAMVSPKGFTAAAKSRAQGYGMALYSPVDTGEHKWQAKVKLPVICDWRSVSISFEIRCSAPMPFRMPGDFFQSVTVYDQDRMDLGTCIAAALTQWNSGHLPFSTGEHGPIKIFGGIRTTVDNGYGNQIPVSLGMHLLVKQTVYFGFLEIVKIRGLRDEHTGNVVTNAFTTGVLDEEEVEKTWQLLKPGEAPPRSPAMVCMALDCYEFH